MSSTYQSLNDAIMKRVADALMQVGRDVVRPRLEKKLKEHIEKDIYDANPGRPKEGAWVDGTTYRRRHALENNIIAKVTPDSGGVLVSVTSDAEPSPSIMGQHTFGSEDGAFFELLENGDLGFMNKVYGGAFPRPAVTNAQQEIDADSGFENTIANEVKKRLK